MEITGTDGRAVSGTEDSDKTAPGNQYVQNGLTTTRITAAIKSSTGTSL